MPRITSQKQWTVWIRPRGSKLWTIHTKPIYHSDRRLANNLASTLAVEDRVCAVVRELDFPGDPDSPEHPPYIEIADGEGRIERFDRDEFWIPTSERADELGGDDTI
jgi:hypothetical protein